MSTVVEREGGERRPLRVGVTGHRFLAEIDKVDAGIDEALRGIATAFPQRPLLVVSSLAEGADRVVARRILDRCPDARLLVPLPIPKREYLEDFPSAASREEFESLLARATCVVESQAQASGEHRGPTRGDHDWIADEGRHESYQAAGIFVLDHCDALIAIWDGRRGQGQGGTAGVVALARKRGMPLAWIRAGNRKPGTNEPTSLADEQGKVVLERFDALGDAGDAGIARPNAGLPYRIRIGVTVEGAIEDAIENPQAVSRALDVLLPQTILGLFDAQSREWIVKARHTPIAFSVVPALGAADASASGGANGNEGGNAGRSADATAAAATTAAAEMIARVLDATDATVEALPRDEASPSGRRRDRLIVSQCDVLIALGSRGPGARNAMGPDAAAPAAILAQAEAKQRPVIHIDPGPPCTMRVSRGHGLNAKSIVRLDMFNGFPVGDQELTDYVANTYRDLFDSDAGQRLPEPAREIVRTKLLPGYARASLVAKRSQRIYRRAGKLVWLLFPAAIAAVAVGVLVPAVAIPAFALEFLLLATIAVVVTYADRQRSLQVWIESRYLTERMRAAAYLAACGHAVAPLRVPPYMGGAEQRDAWMVLAFNETSKTLPPMAGCTADTCAIVRDFIDQAWVAGQIEYHRKNAARCARMAKRLERWGTIMFLLALLAAALHIALPKPDHSTRAVEGGLTFLAIVLPAAGAAMGGFRSHREFSRLAKRSRSMEQELRELQERLAEADSPESMRQVLHEVEETMLGETQDWLMLMRFVPVQYPG